MALCTVQVYVLVRPQVILASADTDSSLKAGMLRTLTARIDRIVHYAFLEGSAMRSRSGRSGTGGGAQMSPGLYFFKNV